MAHDENDPLRGLPDHDPGEFPDDFVDPIANADLPWIVEYHGDEHEKVPPAERLAEEPGWDVAAEEDEAHPRDRRGLLQPRTAPSLGGINLRDYSRNATARGFGGPCSAKLATIQLSQARVSVDVRIAELVGLIMKANEKQGYIYRRADTGAYNCRHIAGSSQWSNHAWGLAVDANWQSNPMRRPLHTDRPRWELDRWNRYGFAWGGDYSGGTPPDAMHMEFMGSVGQIAAVLAAARAELTPIIGGGGVTPVPNPPGPTPAPNGWHDIGLGGVTDLHAKGEQVRRDQADLIDTGFGVGPAGADGMAGDATVAAIRAFQAAAGIGVDGAMGNDTRTAIHKVASYPGDHNYRAFQQRLHDRGWNISVDGAWGPASKRTLAAFQSEKGLTADGIPGPVTWTALWLRGL
jgi:hypothetical protein